MTKVLYYEHSSSVRHLLEYVSILGDPRQKTQWHKYGDPAYVSLPKGNCVYNVACQLAYLKHFGDNTIW